MNYPARGIFVLLLIACANGAPALAGPTGGSYYASETNVVPAIRLWEDYEASSVSADAIAIQARHRSPDGAIVKRDLQSGEAIFFEAVVRIPAADRHVRTVLAWEVFDSADSPLPGIFKTIAAREADQSQVYNFLLWLDHFDSGIYKVRVSRRRVEDSAVLSQSEYSFRVKDGETRPRTEAFGSNISRSFTLTWARTNERGTTFLSDGTMVVRGTSVEGQIKYSYSNARGLLQVMTISLTGVIDDETGRIAGTLAGLAVMNPIWGPSKEGRFKGEFRGSEVGGGFRGTWEGSSDVAFLFQSEHKGRWETR